MMISLIRCSKAEYQKYKHSVLLYIHVIVPTICAIIFAVYYHISAWEPSAKISGYLEVLAVAFPFLIGIIVGIVVQTEELAGHFQIMLGTIPARKMVYIGKVNFLICNAFGSIILALGIFAVLYKGFPTIFYIRTGLLLLLSSIPIYLIHLFVGMNFGKEASMGLGITGSLISALMITGLGDNIWHYIPWAWSVRMVDYTILAWKNPYVYTQMKEIFVSGIIISMIFTIGLLIASLIWFQHWEGGKYSE